MSKKKIRDWIIDPNTVYVIQTEEEYDLICERVDILFDRAIQDNLDDTLKKLNGNTPNMLELNKLVDAIDLWGKRRGGSWHGNCCTPRAKKIKCNFMNFVLAFY